MTTISTSTVMLHNSDAAFQAWVDDFHAMLVGCGLVQTADTGQLASPCVAAKPGAGSYAGYEVWRFNDSLQGTAPIFLKFEYGSNASDIIAQVRCNLGTATDGAGNLSNLFLTNTLLGPTSSTMNATSAPNYACHTEGAFFICMNSENVQGRSRFFLAIGRTCDNTGAITGLGAVVFVHGGGSSISTCIGSRCVRFSPTFQAFTWRGQSSAEGNNFLWLPGSETNTAVGADTQTFPCLIGIPQMLMVPAFGVAMLTELSLGSTAAITYIGSTQRTYIQMGQNANYVAARKLTTDDALCGLLCLWE